MWFPRKGEQGAFGQGHAVRYQCLIRTPEERIQSREWYVSVILTASNLTSLCRNLGGASKSHAPIRLSPYALTIPFFCLITLQIFDDRSTFRGIIKTKAAHVVRLYDFYPKQSFNNQEEQEMYIKDAIQDLLDGGNFLHGGLDERVRPFNPIYQCY